MSVIPCNCDKSVPETFECGEDFCQACGDCLDCYGGDPCHERDGDAHTYCGCDPDDATPPTPEREPGR